MTAILIKKMEKLRLLPELYVFGRAYGALLRGDITEALDII